MQGRIARLHRTCATFVNVTQKFRGAIVWRTTTECISKNDNLYDIYMVTINWMYDCAVPLASRKSFCKISQTIRRNRDKSNVQCELLFNFHIRLQMNILLIEYLLPITVQMPAQAWVLMHLRQWLSIRFYELRMSIKSAKRKDAPYNPQKAIDVLENWEKETQKKQRRWREKNNSTDEQKSILKVKSNKCTEMNRL